MIIVRRAAPRDAENLARMLGKARCEDGVAAHEVEPETFRAHAFGSSAHFEAWMARDRSEAAGCAVAHRGYDVRWMRPTFVLAALYVEPPHRRSGLARALLGKVCARAIEIGARQLAITAGLRNAQGINFLCALGAQEQQTATYMLSFDHLEWLAQELS